MLRGHMVRSLQGVGPFASLPAPQGPYLTATPSAFCLPHVLPTRSASAITYSAYVFPDKWVNGLFHQSYVAVAVVNTLVCTALACYSRYAGETAM